jgi:NAD(P)H-quinone oxidoreductase subunit 4
MSGFASELAVFVGFTSSDIYSSTFCTVTVFLAAVGVILTPIYLLSMLRQVFYGSSADLACEVGNAGLQNQDVEGAVCFGTDCVLPDQAVFRDARKREVAISMAFLIPIVAIGVYPQLATKVYDVKTVAVNSQVRESYTIAKANPEFFAQGLFQRSIAQKVAQAPTLAE